jgi:hypothetical protein
MFRCIGSYCGVAMILPPGPSAKEWNNGTEGPARQVLDTPKPGFSARLRAFRESRRQNCELVCRFFRSGSYGFEMPAVCPQGHVRLRDGVFAGQVKFRTRTVRFMREITSIHIHHASHVTPPRLGVNAPPDTSYRITRMEYIGEIEYFNGGIDCREIDKGADSLAMELHH